MTGSAHTWGLIAALCTATALFATGNLASAADENIIQNADFDTVREVATGAEGLYNEWKLSPTPRIPDRWIPNPAYHGTLTVLDEGSYSGSHHIRLTAPQGRSAHLYQMLEGLEAGAWYKLSLWIRGGNVVVRFYEYFADDPIKAPMVIEAGAPDENWRQIIAYYSPSGQGYQRSAIALCADAGASVEVDAVSLVPTTLEAVEGENVVLTTDEIRLVLQGNARLQSLTSLLLDAEYAPEASTIPLCTLMAEGYSMPAMGLRQEGDLLHFVFPDPAAGVTLRVRHGARHLHFEVVEVQPESAALLQFGFPVTRLATVGRAFNATYDDTFGVCFFTTAVNAYNIMTTPREDTLMLQGGCNSQRGMVGASFTLVAAAAENFHAAIMEAQQAAGVPSPILDGEWNRFSEPVERSYLFATQVHERDIEELIEYAKIGGFGTIIWLKDDWLVNHGHYEINTSRFPDGVASVKRAVEKIHAAGLHAGVHIFGPSISPNDPYVTPVPDDRLAYVPAPPLTEAVDAQATTITLAAPPSLPPNGPITRAFPGTYLRIGDEIIRYNPDDVDNTTPFRYHNCIRGALGTQPQAHDAGAQVRGMLAMWNYFLMDPDSTLADEVTSRFADLVNECNFDFVYFDASDGVLDAYLDRWYYLNKMHMDHYRKFDRDILYQTSNGTGSNMLWHIVPRSASADGHGDIKGYLDQRWPGILGMAANLTKADIGWYYWFRDVRPDQIEYVCARAMSVDGSISLETSLEAIHRLRQSRQMFEMIGRWEECRREHYFSNEIKLQMREMGKDFRLFHGENGGWELYRAVYEEPRIVILPDGEANVWEIENDLPHPCRLGIEIVRDHEVVAVEDYQAMTALLIEDFTDAELYRLSEQNRFDQFVRGGDSVTDEHGVARRGVSQSFYTTLNEAHVGPAAMVYRAENSGGPGGWTGIGRRFDPALDLSAYKGIGMWIHGDGQAQMLRIQFRDGQGRHIDFLPSINFKGWVLYTQAFPQGQDFDFANITYLLFYYNNISQQTTVEVMLDSLKALPAMTPGLEVGHPVVTLNDRQTAFEVQVGPGQALTHEGPFGTTLWPGGMRPGQAVTANGAELLLQPGTNRVTLTWSEERGFPGGMQVLMYRMWPMEK